MSTLQITPAITVEEVFQALPNATHVFIQYHTDCVGCRLTRFCTLSEVAKIYEITLQALLDDLQKITAASKSKGADDEDRLDVGPDLLL